MESYRSKNKLIMNLAGRPITEGSSSIRSGGFGGGATSAREEEYLEMMAF